MITTKKISTIIIFFFGIQMMFAENPNAYRIGAVKHRLGGGLVLSFYGNHPKHTINNASKAGLSAFYKSEIILSRKTNLLIGLEYLSHGLSFNGYYSVPGYTYLFDKTYAYKHELRMNEIQLPIALKLAFNLEKDNFYSSYFFAGVGARYIFASSSLITNDSTETIVYNSKTTIDFEHQFIAKGLNGFFHGGLGIQNNFRNSGRAAFFEITYKYGISRLHYIGNQNSNDLYIKDAHLSFTIGFRF